MTIAERLEQIGIQIDEQRGKEVGIQIGRETGVRVGLKKAATNILMKNLDEKIISESTMFSLKEIKKLK